MIAKGSQDETEAGRHIAHWHGMIAHWNVAADEFRDAARGRIPASQALLEEADRTETDIREALLLCDTLAANLAPGHELLNELFLVAASLESLSGSIAASAEQMEPRIEARNDVAGLKYLVSALRKDAGLAV